jgi:ferredoxin
MILKKLTKTALDNFVDVLIDSHKVIGVQAKGEKFNYAPLASAKDLRLDYDVTLQSPKQFVLPPREPLMTFERGSGYTSCNDSEPVVIVGVHPYDMIAINQMDKLFCQDNADSHYIQRRRDLTIIACDVAKASKNVFAASMGTAVVREGFDILLTDIGGAFVAEAATDKGEPLLMKADGAVDVNDDDLILRKQVWDKNKKELAKHQLECDTAYLPKLLDKAYDHKVWEEKAKTCFSCGSCNLVCPTCYCFDVQDDVDWDLKKGRRERCWDGCLLDGFTKVAGDHEFRKARADRFRHRLYRKAKYVPEKIGGEVACVGCGRCIDACLPDIANPVAVYNTLLEDIGIS